MQNIEKPHIHASAVVSPKAVLHKSVTVGPYCVVGEGVVLGEGCCLHSHVVLEGRASFGKNNRFFPFASLGLAPPDVKFKGEDSFLEVGDNNVFREGVTVHRGTENGGFITRLGSGNLLLPYVHIGHDCQVGSFNIFVNHTALAGHVVCGDYVNLGGHTLVAPFCKIHDYVHTAAACKVTKHVPAFLRLAADPARPVGVNSKGMQRNLVSEKAIGYVSEAYKIVFKRGALLKDVKEQLLQSRLYEQSEFVRSFFSSLCQDARGIVR